MNANKFYYKYIKVDRENETVEVLVNGINIGLVSIADANYLTRMSKDEIIKGHIEDAIIKFFNLDYYAQISIEYKL